MPPVPVFVRRVRRWAKSRSTPPDRKLEDSDLDRSVTIMRDRVDRLGVSEPEIRKQGSDQIVIQLPGIKDPAAAAQVIGKTAQLELYDLEADPWELKNVARSARHAAVRARLRRELRKQVADAAGL